MNKIKLTDDLLEAGEMARQASIRGDSDEAIKWYKKISEISENLAQKTNGFEKKSLEELIKDANNEIEKIKKIVEKQIGNKCVNDEDKDFDEISLRQEPVQPFFPKNPTLVPFVNDVRELFMKLLKNPLISLCVFIFLIIKVSLRRNNINTKWTDIANLDNVKYTLRSTIMTPLKFKKLMKDRPFLASVNGILLFGPSGTGKTMLAKAVATEGQTAFFEVNPSNLISKWRGDSLKIFECLMQAARYYAPSTVFFDEIDVFCSKRGHAGEAEHSRRLKAEFLTQMDGIKGENKEVLFLGATNFPWDLDNAILRRMQRRCYIPLPSRVARKRMLDIYLGDYPIATGENVNLDEIAEKLEGYSGSDIYIFCRTIARLPVERFLSERINIDPNEPIPLNVAEEIRKEYLSDGTDQNSINRKLPLLRSDFERGLNFVKKSVGSQEIAHYEHWDKEFGAYADERYKYTLEDGNHSSSSSPSTESFSDDQYS